MTLFNFFAITNPGINPKVGTGEGNVIIGDLISRLIKIALILGVLVCFLYLMLGGFQWMTSGGEKEGVQTAKQKITQAIVGLAILASAWAIIVLIGKFLGIQLLGGPIKLPTPE